MLAEIFRAVLQVEEVVGLHGTVADEIHATDGFVVEVAVMREVPVELGHGFAQQTGDRRLRNLLDRYPLVQFHNHNASHLMQFSVK